MKLKNWIILLCIMLRTLSMMSLADNILTMICISGFNLLFTKLQLYSIAIILLTLLPLRVLDFLLANLVSFLFCFLWKMHLYLWSIFCTLYFNIDKERFAKLFLRFFYGLLIFLFQRKLKKYTFFSYIQITSINHNE